MRVLELYSGIGGMHYALRESGVDGRVIAAVDINNVANEVYKHNFPEVSLINRNIQSISVKEIVHLNVDTILMSPPCQPFTRLGLQKDKLDNRSSSLCHIIQMIPQLTCIKYILLENVKGFEESQSRDDLVDCLLHSGFRYKELILSPTQFGIPNSRHRYYLLAKRKNLDFCFANNTVLENNLSPQLLSFLAMDIEKKNSGDENLPYELAQILEENVDEDVYLLPSQILRKRGCVLDVRNANSRGSCCFTKAYGRYVEGTGSVFCPLSKEILNRRLSEWSKCNNQSDEQLQLLSSLKLRYFTPCEVARLMCFPEDFKFPSGTTDKQKYRLLGNSINVYVVSKLIHLLFLEKVTEEQEKQCNT